MESQSFPIIKFFSKASQIENALMNGDEVYRTSFRAELSENWFQFEYLDCKLFCEYDVTVQFLNGEIFLADPPKITKFFTSEKVQDRLVDDSKTNRIQKYIQEEFDYEYSYHFVMRYSPDLYYVIKEIHKLNPISQEVVLGSSGYEIYDPSVYNKEFNFSVRNSIIIKQSSDVSNLLKTLDHDSRGVHIKGRGWISVTFRDAKDVLQELLITYYIFLEYHDWSNGAELRKLRIESAILSGSDPCDEDRRYDPVYTVLRILESGCTKLEKLGLLDISYVLRNIDTIIDTIKFDYFTVAGKPELYVSVNKILSEEIKEINTKPDLLV